MRKPFSFLFKNKTIELLENSEINILVLLGISINFEFVKKGVSGLNPCTPLFLLLFSSSITIQLYW